VGDSGEQLGIMKTKDALNMALDQGLDLVEIAPNAEIPVCRIMDYGKFKFEKSKKDKEVKKRQRETVVEVKEVQLSPRIDTHDFNTRLGHARKFIEAGNKVKVYLDFRAREMAHMEIGYGVLEKFEQSCLDFAVVEKRPLREGRRLSMFLAPKKEKAAPQKKSETPPKIEKSDEAQAADTENSDE